MKKIQCRSEFTRFFFSYIIVLIVPILIGIYAYYITTNEFEEEAKKSNLAILDQSRDTLDVRLNEIEDMVTRLLTNNQVNGMKAVVAPMTNENYYKIYQLQKEISVYDSNKFIAGLYLYFANSDTIVTSTSMYTGLTSYGSAIKHDNLTFSQWKTGLTNDISNSPYTPVRPVAYQYSTQNRIAYIKTFLNGSNQTKDGSIVVLIDEEKMKQLLQPLLIDQGGWAYIVDSEGRIIASTDSSKKATALDVQKLEKRGYFYQKLDGESMLVSYTTSSYNGWRYCAVLPKDTVLAKAVYIKKMIWVIAIIAILFGLILAIAFAYRNSKPFIELIESIKEFMIKEGPKTSGFEVIKGTITALITNNEKLSNTMKEQAALLQATVLGRLLRGEIHNEKEFDMVLSLTELQIKGQKYGILLLRITGYNELLSQEILQEMSVSKAIVKNCVVALFGNKVGIFDKSEDMLALLFGLDASDDQVYEMNMEASANTLYNEIAKHGSIRIRIAIGNGYENRMDVWHSYEEAREAMDSNPVDSDGFLVWYKAISIVSNHYFYPVDMEARLINLVKSGDVSGTEKLLTDIFDENYKVRYLSMAVRTQFIQEMRGTLIKLSGQLQLENCDHGARLKQLDHAEEGKQDENREFIRISELFISMCTEINLQKISRNDQLKQQMIRYMQERYMETDFSLASMADDFNLSESYVSFFFKEHTGVNISVYIENIRMEHACYMLENTRSTITDISTAIGYSSDKVFRRAFKRCKGIQPSAYRSLVHNEGIEG